jgi:hypothetical protein
MICAVGQIWKEDDHRFTRYVEIQKIVGKEHEDSAVVFVRGIRPNGDYTSSRPPTKAAARRFGKRHGYLFEFNTRQQFIDARR